MKKNIMIFICVISIFCFAGCNSFHNSIIEKYDYKDISELDKNINKEYLFRYNNILYSLSKDNAVIDLTKCNEFVGTINTLINESYIPSFNGETNNKELVDAKVCYTNNYSSVIELKDGGALLFDAIHYDKEIFLTAHTIDDGRIVHFAADIPYKKTTLYNALSQNKISINTIISNLKLKYIIEDGGSKLYEYNSKKRIFGNEKFYLLECNTVDKISDIFIAKKEETLSDLCRIKIDEVDNVKMTIKENTLTHYSATVIINDETNMNYIYGEYYKIQKLVNDNWVDLKPKNILLFDYIAYQVNGTREFNLNWENYYGKLEDGTYRILKDFGDYQNYSKYYVSVEFTLATLSN